MKENQKIHKNLRIINQQILMNCLKIFELSKNRTKLRHDGELFFEAAKIFRKDLFKGYTNL